MSVAQNVKDLQQQARTLERAVLVQVCHLVRKAVPEAKTFLVTLEVRGHEQLQASFEVGAYRKGDAWEWDNELTTEESDAVRDLELLLAGCPKFNVVGDKTITIAKLIGESETSDDLQEEEPEEEVEVPAIRQVGEGWEVDLGTADFRGVLSALPLEDGEFFIEIAASSTGSDITSIDATGEPGVKVRAKVSTNRRTTTLAKDAQSYIEDLLNKAKDVDALRPSIEAMGQVVVTIS